MTRLFPLLYVVSFAAACTAARFEPDGGGEGPTLSFGSDPKGVVDPYDLDAALPARVQAFFSSCGGGPETFCHSSSAGGLTLRLGPKGDVVNVPSTERHDRLRVRPYDAENSYLYLKLVGDGGIEGGRMPLGGAPDPRALDLVREWIEAGAPVP